MADERGFELVTVVDDVTYLRQRPGQSLGFFDLSQLGRPTTSWVVPTNTDQVVGPPTRIWAGAEAVQTLASLIDDQLSDGVRYLVTYRGEQASSMDIVNSGSSKGLALTRIAGILGVPQQRTMAIGDNENDIEMFRASAVSIAVRGAPLRVAREATHVGPEDKPDTVAWAFRRFVLK